MTKEKIIEKITESVEYRRDNEYWLYFLEEEERFCLNVFHEDFEYDFVGILKEENISEESISEEERCEYWGYYMSDVWSALIEAAEKSDYFLDYTDYNNEILYFKRKEDEETEE